MTMNTYLCDDGNAEIELQAETAREAAQQYVDSGDWGEIEVTSWVEVWVQEIDSDGEEIGERDRYTVAVDPEEPECSHDDGHDWKTPYELLGGLKENPGVWGKGGGIVFIRVCAHCGMYRTTDSWAQNPETGEQGLKSVKYEDADGKSEAWAFGHSGEGRVLNLIKAHGEDAVNQAIRAHLDDSDADVNTNDGEVISGAGLWIRGTELAEIADAVEKEIE